MGHAKQWRGGAELRHYLQLQCNGSGVKLGRGRTQQLDSAALSAVKPTGE